jgi:threonylcarbamoyladenosine tRNA methylthiotransferase MtaB
MMMNTFKIYTLGCKVNQHDTQSIRERFLSRGFKEIRKGKKAGIYIINTCTVTAGADRQSRALLRMCGRLNPKAKIIVTGCLVQQDASSLAGLKGIYLIISKKFFPEGISDFSGHTRAFLKIQDGCNNFCSYCKVPLVRGISRSRPVEEIAQEARQLVKNGFKEIVLTGICLGAYGKDLSAKKTLLDVLKALEEIAGLLRIRLSSIEASDISAELITHISGSDKICRHLHIPIQSGDDEILKKMNRRYSRQDYFGLIKRIKRLMPEIAVSTDILVGFPGENEIHFKSTLDLVKRITPLKVHIFPYSRREGTYAADNFKDEVAAQVMKKRISVLEALSKACGVAYKKRYLHTRMEALIEGRCKENPAYWQGYTDNYIRVLVSSDSNLQNQLIPLKLRRIVQDYVIAEPS